MYLLYRKTRVEQELIRYDSEKRVKFFGCKEGLIPKFLLQSLPIAQNQPYRWHVSVEEALRRYGYPNSSLIINLKPNDKRQNLSLYEVKDVWGDSGSGWTPILMRLDGLFTDADPSLVDSDHFSLFTKKRPPIYTFLYLAGSIGDGKLTGKWIAPRASPTNSVLLWPNTLNYFVSCIGATTPEVLSDIAFPSIIRST